MVKIDTQSLNHPSIPSLPSFLHLQHDDVVNSYGALQGLSKNNPELTTMHGAEQMTSWRREMMATPPPMDEAHPHYNPPPAPLTESLYDCQQRVLRYWHGAIVPTMIPKERSILIAAHANTIR